MSYGQPIMPGAIQGYPPPPGSANPNFMNVLDCMLQEKFTQLEMRLLAKLANSGPAPPTTSDPELKENLIRIEEKVNSFPIFFAKLEQLSQTTDSIMVHIKSGDVKAEQKNSATKPGGININLLPQKTGQPFGTTNHDGPSLTDLVKTTDEILDLVRAIDVKVDENQVKVLALEAKINSLQQNKVKENSSNASFNIASLINEKDKCDSSDLRVLLEQKLVPVQAVSDKLDMLIKQDKDLGIKILSQFSTVTDSIKDVHKKACDAETCGDDAFANTKEILRKLEKFRKQTEDQSVKAQVSQMEAGVEAVLKVLVRVDENSKSLRKNLESKTSSKDRRTSSRAGRRRSDSESDAKETTRRRSRSSSNDVTVVSVQSSVDKKGRKKKKNVKKRSRSSSTSSVENDTKRIGLFDEKLLTSIDKNVTKLIETVDDVESRIEAWMKSSKKTMYKSDETTNCLLQQMVTNNKTLETLVNQQRLIEDQVSDLNGSKPGDPTTSPSEIQALLTSLDARVQKFGDVLETLQNDQNGHFKNLSEDVMSINDRTERLSKLDEVMQKMKVIYKQGTAQESNIMKTLKDVESSIQKLEVTLTENADPKATIRDTILVMNDLLPKMDDFYTRVLPILEDLKKLQRQAADQDELQEKQNGVDLQRILLHLEEIATKATKPSDPRTLPTDTTLLQVFGAINDLKNLFGQRDQTTVKLLGDLKADTSKVTSRLNDILKTKATEKMLAKIGTSIEEMKKDSVNDMKTLSTMNTTLQGLRLRSSASDSKIETALKDLKQTLTESAEAKLPVNDIEKIVENFRASQDELKAGVTKHNEDTMRLVQRLHEEILETSDVKILESAIQNQSALTAKSVVETLRGDLSFSRSSTDVIAGINSKHVGKDVEDRIVAHFAGFIKEMEKISGISAEILNSVEDLKQLNSSVPHTVHDLVPKIEKLSADVTELPNDIGAITAALEENLGKNVESFIKEMYQTILQEILGKFDVMEQRMAVIKKYAKHGGHGSGNNRSGSTPTNLAGSVDPEAASSETSSLPDHTLPDSATNQLLNEEFAQKIIQHITDECKVLGDGIGHTMDQFISTADTSEVRLSIEALDGKMVPLLLELKDLFHRILREQAKGIVVEEQLEALTQTIVQPIQELKPLQEQLVSLIEVEMKSLLQDRAKAVATTSDQDSNHYDKIMNAQQDCLSLLTAMKRYHEFSSDDRLRDLIGANVDSTVKAMARSKAEEKSAYQVEAVRNLIEFLKRIQATQQDILVNSDRSIEYHVSLSETLFKIVPVLEVIHRTLNERKSQKLDSGSLPALCSELREKLVSLAELERKLISEKQDRSSEDLCSLIQMCKAVMEQLSVETVETKESEVEIKDADLPKSTIDSYLPVIASEIPLPDIPVENYLSDIPDENSLHDIPMENLLPVLCEDLSSQVGGGDLANLPTSQEVGKQQEGVTKSDTRRSNWGPKTKRVKKDQPGDDDVTNDVTNAKEEKKMTSSTTSERKAICLKLTSSLPSASLNEEERPLLSSKGRRKSGSDIRPKVVDKIELGSKELEVISEEEARKRKYQPQVVVENVLLSHGGRRDSSSDSVKSSDSKKLKKEK